MLVKTDGKLAKKTVLSFVCAVMVLYIHADNTEQYTLNLDNVLGKIAYFIETDLLKNVTMVAVPFFFFLSGVFFFRNYSWGKAFDKYKSRVKSLLIPYLLWNAFYVMLVVLFTLIPATAAFVSDSWKMNPINLNNIIEGLIFYKYHSVYWFMFQLILFVAISPILFALLKNRTLGLLISVTLLFSPVYNQYIPLFNLERLFYFFLGGYLGYHYFNILMKNDGSKRKSVIAILVFIALFVIDKMTGNYLICNNLVITAYIAALFYGVDLLGKIQAAKYMSYSFFIYSSHLFVLSMLKLLFRRLLPQTDIFAILNFLIVPIIALMLIVLTARLLEKYLPKLFKILNGGR